ncbi:uncharacterized protein LOC110418945 [Herrania umbratica]|uniref:Uncharacterized protein LOC110418945 n=1 Tax=Herrania umbratica TaxID=108875 RepID=A0A6J1AKN3_9ROSI|nr:uncharacterized protein LOC110418945 [Herrania umbratica]XP_021287444.1 uncharacterized protein LOC110418945 [Herrania umbratica]XP_021287445.1 uncharacterized protein LOC110418945 [Herrania umbratica]XP_021287446.1 uncharacterized protein LOC110418945 [Herrania umbratica]XP_021287447.1 uncharacterized protein LOC110418945 [Herrania umbratica]
MAGGHTTIAFNVDEDDYQTFIQSLRSILSYSTSHDLNVLMPQTQPLSWLDIRLTSGDSTMILRIEKRNLYVRGYSRDNGTTFWEFSDSSLISRSTPLAYTGSYADGYTLINAAGVTRETVQLGFSNLSNAIVNLATTENPNSTQNNALQNCARALLVLTQMIAESARFQLTTDHIVTNWYNSAPLTWQLVELEQGFESFSSAVQRADFPYWTNNTPLPNVPHPNRFNIWTVGQAIAALGILLYVPRTSNRVKRQTDVGASTARNVDTAADTNVSYVRTLVSIEYVRVNDIDGEDPGDLYGTVKVKDFWGLHTVYDRSSSDYESKGPGGYATLTGPSTAISGGDVFIIKVNLWDHDSLSPDDEIAQGDIVWEPRKENITFTNYDKRLEKVVYGENGNVTVGYSVIRQALNATIEVLLISGDNESPADVYGTIKASQDLGGSSTSLSLFEKSSDEYVEVRPYQSIPLTRSVVVAPVSSGLTITTDLWDYDTASPDDQIAKGSAHFDAMVGTQTKSIYGEYGEVQVSITCE